MCGTCVEVSIYVCHISQESYATYLCFTVEPMSVYFTVSVYSVLHNGLGMSHHNDTYVFAYTYMYAKIGPTNLYSTMGYVYLCISQRDQHVHCSGPLHPSSPVHDGCLILWSWLLWLLLHLGEPSPLVCIYSFTQATSSCSSRLC